MSLNMHSGSKTRKIAIWIICIVATMTQVNCGNALTPFGDKTDDEALFYKANEYVNHANYASAISACNDISPGYLSEARVATVCASAYAGRCGFTLTNMVDTIESYLNSPPSEKILHWYMTQISGTTATNISDCNTAISIINQVGAATNRSADLNSFMTLLSIYTLSVVLNETGDIVDDAILDGGFDACAISAADAQVSGLAFWELNKSLTALSTNSFYAPMFTIVDTVCSLMAGEALDLCAATTPLALNAAELNGARSIFKEGAALGVDQCGGGLPISPGCKCP